jgi:hypothetical protein
LNSCMFRIWLFIWMKVNTQIIKIDAKTKSMVRRALNVVFTIYFPPKKLLLAVMIQLRNVIRRATFYHAPRRGSN